MKQLARRGFTVVEVIVIVIVISILVSISVLAFSRVQMDARDQKRKTDIMLFVDAMETYYEKNGEYPSGCAATNASSPNSCLAAAGVLTGGAALFQDTTVTAMRAILPTLPSDFGGPRGDATKPFKSSGASDGMLMRYTYWGQLDGTLTGSNSSAVMGGAYSPSGVDCGLASSNISIKMPNGALPKHTSFFIAYHGESDNMWHIYQGKQGGGLAQSGTSVRGTTIGSCVFEP